MLSLKRYTSVHLLQSLKNAVKRIFSCKLLFWHSRERARQKFANFCKIENLENLLILLPLTSPQDAEDAVDPLDAAEDGLPDPLSRAASSDDEASSSPEPVDPLGGGPVGQLPIFDKISTKCCSFSAISAPIFASKYAFCSIFQNLPGYLAEFFEI